MSAIPPIDLNARTWTYGCEHEIADWDTRVKLPTGFGIDPEPNICNSNGIAADPLRKSYPFGGEINTPPSKTPAQQGQYLQDFLDLHPKSTVNWRGGLHVHIRIPGLKDNLYWLKRLQRFITDNTAVYELVDPLPLPDAESLHPKEEKRRYNWMRMSHFTKIIESRVNAQMSATTPKAFFEREVPVSAQGKPLWHAQPRAGINLRQLLQTDTIEFRHFPATLSPDETVTAVKWCRDYLKCMIVDTDPVAYFQRYYKMQKFPRLGTIYVHWQELRWKATTMSKGLKRPMVEANIKKILQGEFDKIDNSQWPHLIPSPKGIDCY